MIGTRTRARARELRLRLVNQELKQLEAVRRQLLRGEVDVLVLGDSSCLSAAPGDTDRTMIPELLAQTHGSRVACVAGPGFNAGLYAEMLRVLGTLDRRPSAVVASIVVRPSLATHVRRHPIYSYPGTRAALARTTSANRRIRAFGRGNRQTPADYALFEDLPVHSRWNGQTTIGAYRAAVKGQGPHPWPTELRRLLFDYFHGEVHTADHAGLDELRLLGRRIRDYGVPTVGYWGCPPLEQGEQLFPGEFTDFVQHNWHLVRTALLAEAEGLTVVEPTLEDSDFEFSPNATEHYTYAGRLKIAAAVAAVLPPSGLTSHSSR